MKCNKCNLETNNSGCFAKHKKSCDRVSENLEEIIKQYESGKSLKKITKEHNIGFKIIWRIFKKNGIKIRNLSESMLGKSHSHSEKSKKIISEKRKEYLKNNADKHNWKSNNKFRSIPCENFKNILNELKIQYLSEMSISDERFFSIDIALPQYKIGIEVNGNQHYNRDGSLKEYYQDRHDYMESLGWVIHEIHYSLCFDNDVMKKIIQNIVRGVDKIYDFDYRNYLDGKLIKKEYRCECGKSIRKESKKCIDCTRKNQKLKSKRPNDKNSLIEKISVLGYAETSRGFGVSPTTIRRWLYNFI